MMLDIHLHPAITQELAQFGASLEILIDWDRNGQREGVCRRWIRFDSVRVPVGITVVDLRVVQGDCPNSHAILGGGHPCVDADGELNWLPARQTVRAGRAAAPQPVALEASPLPVQSDSDSSDNSDMFYRSRRLLRARVASSSPSRERKRKATRSASQSHVTPPARPVDSLPAPDADGIIRTISDDGVYLAYRRVNDDTIELLVHSDEEEAAFQASFEAD